MFSLHSYEYTEAGLRFRSRSIGCPVQNLLVLVVVAIKTRATAPVGKSQREDASGLSGRELEDGPAGWWRMSSMHDRYIGRQSMCQFGSAQWLGQNCSSSLRG